MVDHRRVEVGEEETPRPIGAHPNRKIAWCRGRKKAGVGIGEGGRGVRGLITKNKACLTQKVKIN